MTESTKSSVVGRFSQHPNMVSISIIASMLMGCAGLNESPATVGVQGAAVTKSLESVSPKEVDAYLYFGWNDAAKSPIGRTVFQDFSLTSGTVGAIWADPDAEFRNDRQSWARSRISRRTGQPFLVVDYAREGHGVNIAIPPREGTPLPIEAGQNLMFDMRSGDDACVGIRVTERDAEIWGYGRPPLDYRLLCAPKGGAWKTYSIPLDGDESNWFHFPYAGNHQLGNKRFESDLLVLVTLELGFEKGRYLGKGVGRVDFRNFHISE